MRLIQHHVQPDMMPTGREPDQGQGGREEGKERSVVKLATSFSNRDRLGPQCDRPRAALERAYSLSTSYASISTKTKFDRRNVSW